MVAGGSDAHVAIGNWFTSGKLVARLGPAHRHPDRRDVGRGDDGVICRPRLFDRLHVGRPVAAALLRIPLAVHVRDVDAGDSGQSGANVLRLGGRRFDVLPVDRLLVRSAHRQRRGHQGLRRQPGRRLRLLARHLPHLLSDRFGQLRSGVRRRSRSCRQDGAFYRLQLGRGHACLPAALHGGDGQVGTVPAAHLAARRDGRPDPGFGPHSCRDDGDGRRVHGGETFAAIRNVADCAECRHHCRWDDGLLRRDSWPGAERHQESDRLFDLFAARLHVRRPWGRRLQPRHFPPFHPRLLQGSVVPRRWLGHHGDASRAGHARDGRPAQGDAHHLLDDDDRIAFANWGRHSVDVAWLCRLRLEGSDHRGCVRLAPLWRDSTRSGASTSPRR